jgi:hypothetical protein
MQIPAKSRSLSEFPEAVDEGRFGLLFTVFPKSGKTDHIFTFCHHFQ